MASRKFKRVLVLSDPHTGASTGLTHPDYEVSGKLKPHKTRRTELWKSFKSSLKDLGKIDHVIGVGDLIHGPAKGKVTDEILANESNKQKEMIIRIFEEIGADTGLLIHGTPWHVDEKAIPIEQEIADSLGYEFHKIAEEHEVNKVLFHVKHKIGGSNDPRTLGNMLTKEYETVCLNHIRHGVPSRVPDIILRGHRHVFHQRGDEKWIGFILPCLQAWGGNVAVQLTTVYYPTVGFMWFDIYTNGDFTYGVNIFELKSQSER
jgi:hypothetical protein